MIYVPKDNATKVIGSFFPKMEITGRKRIYNFGKTMIECWRVLGKIYIKKTSNGMIQEFVVVGDFIKFLLPSVHILCCSEEGGEKIRASALFCYLFFKIFKTI